MAHVIRRFRELDPERRVVARTTAPKRLFPHGVDVQAADFDCGAVEDGALRIDAVATGGRLRELVRNRAEIDIFPRVTDAPLIASVSRREAGEILRDLGVAPADRRKRILIGMRGGLPHGVLERAAAGLPDALFLEPGAVEFADLVKVSHAVVSKLGYGIAAACAAHATPLLYPPRGGFREDAVLEQQLRRYIPMRRITGERFFGGDWKRDLEALYQQAPAKHKVPSNGDLMCARIISETLDES